MKQTKPLKRPESIQALRSFLENLGTPRAEAVPEPDRRHDLVYTARVAVLDQTDRSLKVVTDTGQISHVAKSQTDPAASEVTAPGDVGDIAVSPWLADKMGWIGRDRAVAELGLVLSRERAGALIAAEAVVRDMATRSLLPGDLSAVTVSLADAFEARTQEAFEQAAERRDEIRAAARLEEEQARLEEEQRPIREARAAKSRATRAANKAKAQALAEQVEKLEQEFLPGPNWNEFVMRAEDFDSEMAEEFGNSPAATVRAEPGHYRIECVNRYTCIYVCKSLGKSGVPAAYRLIKSPEEAMEVCADQIRRAGLPAKFARYKPGAKNRAVVAAAQIMRVVFSESRPPGAVSHDTMLRLAQEELERAV